MDSPSDVAGILLVDKPKGRTSFSLVGELRRRLGVKCIGHAGTLDPFATGVMVMLIGREYTKLSDRFLGCSKEYLAEVFLGQSTDTYDCDGVVTSQSPLIPSLEEIQDALLSFQGTILQVPPMYSAKKIQGKKLYELARQGKEIEREPVAITLKTSFLQYNYPYLQLKVECSKGTYIRSIAHDLGQQLKCGAHLTQLQRTKSGSFDLKDCLSGDQLDSPPSTLIVRLLKHKDLLTVS